jgi:hypothetical protein
VCARKRAKRKRRKTALAVCWRITILDDVVQGHVRNLTSHLGEEVLEIPRL